MHSHNPDIDKEKRPRRMSFGIGGAGNIRTPEGAMVHDALDLAARKRTAHHRNAKKEGPSDDVAYDNSERRRSSVISDTIKSVFSGSRRKSDSS
ncbi:hypothetical protein F5Y16DRAFT_402368 [Xylariaceae sp. FL0255]|nr:hypothetical protein F5Y16DRAFT_402368 [Xylariaceae sp. FL0255]